MTTRTRWLLISLVIGAVLGSAYVIVERNHVSGGATDTPSGFMH